MRIYLLTALILLIVLTSCTNEAFEQLNITKIIDNFAQRLKWDNDLMYVTGFYDCQQGNFTKVIEIKEELSKRYNLST